MTRWVCAFALIAAAGVGLVACGDGQPKQLREATPEDLPDLVLQDGDAGPSYDYIDRGISRDVTFIPKANGDSSDGIICINDNAQLESEASGARAAVESARGTVLRQVSEGEEIEVLQPAGLVNDGLAYHFLDDNPLCPDESAPAHGYFIMFHRSNVLCFLAVFTSEEQGPELAVLLAKKQAERIEEILADD